MNKKNKFVIPLSNESIKKALLGASIIVGSFGLIGNTNSVYADTEELTSEIIDENKVDEAGNLDKEEKTNESQSEDKSTGGGKQRGRKSSRI